MYADYIAKSNASINHYSFIDNNIISGTDYYRLKQIDFDGNYHYSSVVKIDFSKFVWSIYGNPVSNSYIQLMLDKPAHIAIQIISISGKIMQLNDKGNFSAGTYSIPLNINSVSSGTYIVKLFVDDKTYSKKIIK